MIYEMIALRGKIAVLDDLAEEHWRQIESESLAVLPNLITAREDFRRGLIEKALIKTKGNKSAAARLLKIDPRSFGKNYGS
jgi:DNA-binding NtrC family response regulator